MFEELHGAPSRDNKWEEEYLKFVKEMTKEERFVGFLFESKKDKMPIASGCLWIRDLPPRPSTSSHNGLEPYLLSMYTVPEYRGVGLAPRIVHEAMKWSKRKGFSRITLHASRMGRPIYKKLGWERGWEMRRKL
jgi:GNAT superfamily N-acetyltransferase